MSELRDDDRARAEESSIRVQILTDVPEVAGTDFDGLTRLVQFVMLVHGSDVARWEINVLLTSDEQIAVMHLQYMGIPGPTDVMTFESDLEPGDDGRGGDIVISVETAGREGPIHGHSAWDEIRFLTVHGLLHLVGFEDADPGDRSEMLEEQARLMRRFDESRG